MDFSFRQASNSGIHLFMYLPCGSNLIDCVSGFMILKYGAASVPVEALHCQPPLLEAISPSTRCSIKNFSPFCQSMSKFLLKNIATIILNLLCIQPVANISLIPASTIGIPVWPFIHLSRYSALSFHGIFFV